MKRRQLIIGCMSMAVNAISPCLVHSNQIRKESNHAQYKPLNFALDYEDDVLVAEPDLPMLQAVFSRLQNLQQTIGFGHFNLCSIDEALRYGKRFANVGEFTGREKKFMEQLFFTDAATYGFYGKKVSQAYTVSLTKADVLKIPKTGHYLYQGDALAYYKQLKMDLGEGIVLTSGVRSNVKQMYLFLAKTLRVQGNLSRAARSVAPPGYSYHSVGDFDVGKVGWGRKNFTKAFADTDEYKRMQDLGYIEIRYAEGNKQGVRFEPWHIKVV